MRERPWYLEEQKVEEYEAYYQNKYRRAELLEKKVLERALEEFDGAERILEVGCGTGHFTRWIESRGFECYGLDISSLMLKQARKMWIGGRFLQGESSFLPFVAKSFDVVTYITSLEYMRSVVAVFAEGARVAKKGIIIGVMNRWSLPTVRKMFRARLRKNSHYANAKFYSVRDIRRLLDESLARRYYVAYWNTTAFPRVFDSLASTLFPFGSFLGLAVKLYGKQD